MKMQVNNSTISNETRCTPTGANHGIMPLQRELMGPFAPWVEGGFTEHLLPVIPPGAQISASSKTLKPDSGGKIPGKLRSDGWVGFKGFQNFKANTGDCAV